MFLVPSTGGEPKQLTFYSGDDQALYWMPDGKSILISSNRGPFAYGSPLYHAADRRLGRDAAEDGQRAPRHDEAGRIAPRLQPHAAVLGRVAQRFRGNSAPGLAVQDQKTGDIVEITNGDMKDYQGHYQDMYPMWGADGMIYFASERDGTYNIWKIAAEGRRGRSR